MKRCAQCQGKLGLGFRSRTVWNGRWRVLVHYCSIHCEALHEPERYNARPIAAARCRPSHLFEELMRALRFRRKKITKMTALGQSHDPRAQDNEPRKQQTQWAVKKVEHITHR